MTRRSRVGGGDTSQSACGCCQDHRPASGGSLAGELVEVVGLGVGERAHREVAQDEHPGAVVLAQPLVPGSVGVRAGEVETVHSLMYPALLINDC